MPFWQVLENRDCNILAGDGSGFWRPLYWKSPSASLFGPGPWARPYVCIELRACAEVVAYGHLKSRACAEEVAYTGICNGCIHAAGGSIYGLSTETTDCSRKSPLHQSKTYMYTCLYLYIFLSGNLSGVIIYFSYSIKERVLIAHANFVILSYLIKMVKV